MMPYAETRPNRVYSGLVVGGPHAGRRVVSDSPIYVVAVLPETPGLRSPIECEKVVYEYRDLLPDGSVAVWVPQGWTKQQTLITVLRGYEAAKKKETQRG